MPREIRTPACRMRLPTGDASPAVRPAPGRVRDVFGQGFALAVLVCMGATDANGQPLQDAASRIVGEERRAAGTPALSVIVMQDGQVLARVAEGQADPAGGTEVTAQTAFPAGSVTKIVTAAVVMTEVDAGRLDLDAPIAPHVPPELRPLDATGAEVDVTLRQLLSHNSGLPVTWDGFPPNPPVESRDAYIAASRTLMYPPGERLVYSNAAFVLAGEVAAASAGMPFEDIAQDRLFTPLGMTRSSLGGTADYDGPLAAGHARGRDGAMQPEPHLDLTPMAAAGSLLTTPDDLARFATMLLDGGVFDGQRILSEAAVEEMTSLQVRAHPDLDEGFGLGFGVQLNEAGRIVWWDGTTTSAASRFALHPASDTVVIAMTNAADNRPTSVTGRRLLELAVPGLSAAPDPVAVTDDTIDGFYLAGDFVDPDLWFLAYAMPFRVRTEDGTVHISSGLTGPMTLIPLAPERFRVSGGLFDGAGALTDGDDLQIGFLRAARLPALLTPPALAAYAGALALAVVLGVGLGIRAIWRRLRRPR